MISHDTLGTMNGTRSQIITSSKFEFESQKMRFVLSGHGHLGLFGSDGALYARGGGGGKSKNKEVQIPE